MRLPFLYLYIKILHHHSPNILIQWKSLQYRANLSVLGHSDQRIRILLLGRG